MSAQRGSIQVDVASGIYSIGVSNFLTVVAFLLFLYDISFVSKHCCCLTITGHLVWCRGPSRTEPSREACKKIER